MSADREVQDIPSGDYSDSDYKSRPGQSHIPVQGDDAPVDDPVAAEDGDSDAQLAKDEEAAIDQSNIIGDESERTTRGATKKSGTYTEPGDEEGLEQ